MTEGKRAATHAIATHAITGVRAGCRHGIVSGVLGSLTAAPSAPRGTVRAVRDRAARKVAQTQAVHNHCRGSRLIHVAPVGMLRRPSTKFMPASAEMIGIANASAAMRRGTLTSVELTRRSLACVERLNPRVNAVLLINPDALEAAEQRDRERQSGRERGPLHGLPVLHKDLLWTKGLRTTGGSRVHADFHPPVDAALVALLDRAGCVVLGKTMTDELGCGTMGTNPRFGRVDHPLRAGHAAGGSSGGSAAAVAAAMTPLATATDTGGSIRIPCAFCGVAGMQVTHGALDAGGLMPLAPSLDQLGWIAGSVADCAIVFHELARLTGGWRSPSDRQPSDSLRIGVALEDFRDCEPDILAAISAAAASARRAGSITVDVRVPSLERLTTIGEVTQAVEAAEIYGGMQRELGLELAGLIAKGRALRGVEHEDARRLRDQLRTSFERLWRDIDCLLAPAAPYAAPPADKVASHEARAARCARFTNVLGLPVVTLPVGLDRTGLPVGAQLIGPAWSERVLLAAGERIEHACALVSASTSRQGLP
jgi:aspartyl-tRNA(Asn)/glutamyl-tRNA(Gln) amidotransferase subunit A